MRQRTARLLRSAMARLVLLDGMLEHRGQKGVAALIEHHVLGWIARCPRDGLIAWLHKISKARALPGTEINIEVNAAQGPQRQASPEITLGGTCDSLLVRLVKPWKRVAGISHKCVSR